MRSHVLAIPAYYKKKFCFRATVVFETFRTQNREGRQYRPFRYNYGRNRFFTVFKMHRRESAVVILWEAPLNIAVLWDTTNTWSFSICTDFYPTCCKMVDKSKNPNSRNTDILRFETLFLTCLGHNDAFPAAHQPQTSQISFLWKIRFLKLFCLTLWAQSKSCSATLRKG